jgi:FlaA1/EpsC-like NDP-sugar epimerase
MMDMTQDEQELLLGRGIESVLTDDDRAVFRGRVCLITGAAGSVGAELARQLVACEPSQLVLVDQSEHGLFRLEALLRELAPEAAIEPVLCDITRASSVQRLMQRVRPGLVFHAAAYKHVTMAERAICATARINVLGTSVVLSAARQVGAQFVLISTDKAAAPHSVMGATKRLAELVALAGDDEHGPRPIVVRFGNVLASSGSFVEVLRERIRDGKPILLTDPDATRFFMTVTEAASLVMKATAIAHGGETFWLDMGPQVRIGDLAERLLEAAERQGIPPVPIEVIGLRPGEKMAEQLASQGIRLEETVHPRVWVAHQALTRTADAGPWLSALSPARDRDDAYGVMTTLTVVVRDFVPSESAWETARGERAAAARLTREAAIERVATPRLVHRTPLARPVAGEADLDEAVGSGFARLPLRQRSAPREGDGGETARPRPATILTMPRR